MRRAGPPRYCPAMGDPRGVAGSDDADAGLRRAAELATVEYLVRLFPDLRSSLAGRYLRGELGTDRWGRPVEGEPDMAEPGPGPGPGSGLGGQVRAWPQPNTSTRTEVGAPQWPWPRFLSWTASHASNPPWPSAWR
jgi:hypothetical protein